MKKKLEVGDPIPIFTLKDQYNNDVCIEEKLGKPIMHNRRCFSKQRFICMLKFQQLSKSVQMQLRKTRVWCV